jgi:hypothetical protein
MAGRPVNLELLLAPTQAGRMVPGTTGNDSVINRWGAPVHNEA